MRHWPFVVRAMESAMAKAETGAATLLGRASGTLLNNLGRSAAATPGPLSSTVIVTRLPRWRTVTRTTPCGPRVPAGSVVDQNPGKAVDPLRAVR